ncbi:MAG: S-layer homology domain-containing protein [Phormidesmis sp.]
MKTAVSKTLGAITAIASFLLATPVSAQQPRKPSLETFPNYQFSDVQDHWAWVCIEGAGEDGLMKGYLDGRFQPNGTMTRAEFAAVMVKAFPDGERIREAPNFLDVSPDFWGKEAIATAYQNGFLAGYPNNLFKPNQPISRAQAIIVIARAQARVSESAPETLSTGENVEAVLQTYYKDAANIPAYAKLCVAEATRRQIVANYPIVDRLNPNGSITRGDATALLCRANIQGADARHYVPAEYVAAFNNGIPQDEGTKPKLIGNFPAQSTDSLFLFKYATFPAPDTAPDTNVDYTQLKRLFFSADDGRHGEELWVTDGTVEGTRLFLDVAPGFDAMGEPRSSAPDFVGFADDRVWFATNQRFVDGERTEAIWSSDGTVEGTRAIASISPSLAQTLSEATDLTAYPNFLLNDRFPFMVNTPSGYQLWLSDGVSPSGTQRMVEFPQLDMQSASPTYEFTVTLDRLFFLAPSTDQKTRLWTSDGTAQGTGLLSSEIPFQTTFKAWENRIFFPSFEPSQGLELWTSDGTVSGTLLVKDLYLGSESSQPSLLEELGSSFLVLATDTEGFGLWSTEGTSASTRRIKLLKQKLSLASSEVLQVHNNKMYFLISGFTSLVSEGDQTTAEIFELWITDGTAEGTKRLQSFVSNRFSPSIIFKDRLFFGGNGPTGTELWTSDGTAEGTRQVVDLSPGATTALPLCPPPPPEIDPADYCQATVSANGSTPIWLTVRGEFLYFITEGNELFRTDGTGAGMQHIQTLNITADNPFTAIASIDAALLFTAYDETTGGLQLWALPD